MASDNHKNTQYGPQYEKINLSRVDRKKVKQKLGIETTETIKIVDEMKRPKELLAYPCPPETEPRTVRRCYWDHHVFDGPSIFCPLNYVPKQVAKKGQNEIKTRIGNTLATTRLATTDSVINSYTIRENISKYKDVSDHKNLIEVTDAYYEVDGVFCSPECCLAFINNEKSKAGGSQYADSERLLYSMLELSSRIFPANSYRLLKEYGGNLTIEEFRSKNKGSKYKCHGTTVLVSHLFEKKLNLLTE